MMRYLQSWLVGMLLIGAAAKAAPTDTDVNVTFIERTPRYDYNAAKNNPAPGDTVTFTGHIKLWGAATVPAIGYRWQLDGQTVATGTLTDVAPGQERTVTWQWTWQNGAHDIKLTADPDGLISEFSEVNNEIEDRTNAVIWGLWVEQSRYNFFAANQYRLVGAGSNSWEDWAQRHVRYWNQFNAAAVYPITPNGVEDRVRLDKIVVVPDGALPLAGGLPTNNPNSQDRTVDMMWGFPSSETGGYTDLTTPTTQNRFYYEGSLLHELGHARYLIDSYGFDVHNTAAHGGYDSVQIWEGATYVGGSAYMPFLAFNEVLHYNTNGSMMAGGYDQGWSEYEAGALNRIAGRRARCGNANAPCNIGEYLQDLPANNHLRITDQDGHSRRGANVRVYQAANGPGWYGKTFDNTPDLELVTDAGGSIHFGRNPFTKGTPIQHTFGIANSIVILRIAHAGQIWYRFWEASELNLEYWRGHTQDGHYTLALTGPNPVAADFDLDTDVDQADLAHLRGCLSGAGQAPDEDCANADLDSDGDVDQSDFGFLQRCLGKSRVAADPACMGE